MNIGIDMGALSTGDGQAVLDLEELLATRLLVQGNSGSGKSHLLRRLLEQSASVVQQCVIDPEGDFVTLAERFGHVVVDAARAEGDLQRIAARVRQHRVSVVLNLEGLDAEQQMRCAAAFLGGLFEAERDLWYPMLVVVDEAQLFAPAAAGEVSDEARKVSLGAMTNLMCRGRKRGLAGIIATQRLAKLAKNVAAEASNFLMGRTFLDIDMARAADLLGMERRQAEMFRDLERGHFVALGPGPVAPPAADPHRRRSRPRPAAAPSSSCPCPSNRPEDARDLIFKAGRGRGRAARRCQRRAAPPPPPATDDLLAQLARARPPAAPAAEPAMTRGGRRPNARSPSTPSCGRSWPIRTRPSGPMAVLYQDFLVRCRIRRIGGEPLDLPAFRRRLAVARAGVERRPGGQDPTGTGPSRSRPISPRTSRASTCCSRGPPSRTCHAPRTATIARACGSRSPGRARRLVAYHGEPATSS